ncbi:MAG: hypothetical protein AAFX06_04905 [Planctomycetota bacterium]
MTRSRLTSSSRWQTLGLLIAVTLAAQVGCGKMVYKGGGMRSVNANKTSLQAVYGADAPDNLAFVVFTDVDTSGSVASAGSSWTGSITRPEGKAIDYEGDGDGITIDGTAYSFTDGRVFLVATDGDTITVTQTSVPIRKAKHNDEIDRLSQTDEVRSFLAEAGEPEASSE